MANDRFGTTLWLKGQLALLALAIALLGGWPPRSGAMMLVPLGGAATARLVPMAVTAHALLIGPGPLPGSYIVRGERRALVTAMLSAGILVLAAPSAGCAAGSRA